jgi:hypothetical protein
MIPYVLRQPGPTDLGKATIAQTGTVRRVLLGDGKAQAPARARWVRPLASGRAARCETRGGRRRANCQRANYAAGADEASRTMRGRPRRRAVPGLAQARPTEPPGPRQKAQHLAIETAPGSTAAGPQSKPAARKAPVVPTPPAGSNGSSAAG